MDNNLENEQNKIFFERLKKKNGMGSSQIMNEKNDKKLKAPNSRARTNSKAV